MNPIEVHRRGLLAEIAARDVLYGPNERRNGANLSIICGYAPDLPEADVETLLEQLVELEVLSVDRRTICHYGGHREFAAPTWSVTPEGLIALWTER